MILPSGWIALVQIELFAPVPGLKEVSRLPSAFRRAIWFLAVPLKEVKVPPMMIFPSDWIWVVKTELSAPVPGLNELSRLPSAFRRAIRFLSVPL